MLSWLGQLVDFPAGGGLLVSGGSAATLTALAMARHRATGGNVRRQGVRQGDAPLVVYTSTEGHSAIGKAVEALGLGADHLRRIPVDADRRMRLDLLARAVDGDQAAGRRPMAVAATAGSASTGAVDPLDPIADLCGERGLWLHVDGAYGAPAVLDPRCRERLAPMARADSLAMDAHKWLSVPYDAGAVLVRDAELMRETFSLVPAYLREDSDPDGVTWLPWFSEFGLEQTRPFRALKVWMALRQHGRAGYARAVARDLDHAEQLAALADAHPRLELVARGLSIVCFRYATPALPPAEADRRNRAVLKAVQLGGEAFLTGTEVDGRLALRACFVNQRTTRHDVERLVGAVLATAG